MNILYNSFFSQSKTPFKKAVIYQTAQSEKANFFVSGLNTTLKRSLSWFDLLKKPCAQGISQTKVKASRMVTNLDQSLSMEYSLDNFHRSNQDTCLVHKPSVFEGQWVQSGDLLADCSASVGGELALGQNLLIAYMPWEGYNFEDAILISERLVYDDLYTSIHIERYEVEIRETKLGMEQITREIPDASEESIQHLHHSGIAKLGSWIQEGDILVGKVTPINKKSQSNYQKLLYTILEKPVLPVRDSSLRAPKGIQAKVVGIQIFKKNKPSLVSSIQRKQSRPVSLFPSSPPYKASFSSLSKKGKKTEIKKKKVLNQKNLRKKHGGALFSKKNSFFSSIPFLEVYNQTKTLFYENKHRNQINSFSYTKKKMAVFKDLSFLNLNNKKREKSQSKDLVISNQITNSFSSYLNLNKDTIITKELRSQERFLIKNPSVSQMDSNPFAEHSDFSKLKKAEPFLTRSALHKQKQRHTPRGTIRLRFLKKYKINKILGKNKTIIKESTISPTHGFFEVKRGLFSGEKSLLHGVSSIQIYLAEKRRMQVGDKMAGRHGNKGIISQILPPEDMPFLPDGTPLDMVLNPLGVPSRMNVGQIYECLLGLAGKHLGENFKVFPFDEIYGAEASRSFVYSKLYNARVKTGKNWLFNPNSPGKMRLYDGRTGERFDQAITVGYAYMLRLVHMVDDKIHARSTGPYSLVTQQPLRGRSKQGGQRLGEMEVWALEGYGAAFTLLEMLTIKSDDMTGRMTLWSNLILNKEISIGTPESFKVLICELQALCLDIGLFRVDSTKTTTQQYD